MGFAGPLCFKGGIVPGGGIAELNAARYLEKKMLEGKSQNIGCGILIKGLESISRQILDNAGYNGYEMMIRLRSQPDGVGINVVDGDYINMIENGIIDSRITKMHADTNCRTYRKDHPQD